jgi:hypothetical protein
MTVRRFDQSKGSNERFFQAMAYWMQAKKMRVGLHPEDIDLSKDIKMLDKVAGIAAQVVSSLSGGNAGELFVFGGSAKADKVVRALTPYASLVDMLGFKPAASQYLMLVINGDNFSSQDILERLNLFMELAEPVADLGMYINFQRAPLSIIPIVIYFNSENCRKNKDAILSAGWKAKFWSRIWFRACVVDVPQKTISWARVTGIVSSLNGTALFFSQKFTSKDLQTILSLVQQLG